LSVQGTGRHVLLRLCYRFTDQSVTPLGYCFSYLTGGKTMTHYLKLDLNSITIDPQLARQVPYALSRYYLALPLGRENGAVSVAMAYPENKKARQILGHLLQAKVVPLLASGQSIQQILERVHCPEQQVDHSILAWCGQPEWETAVTTAASALGHTFHTKVTALTAPESDLRRTLSQAAGGTYELSVCPLPDSKQLLSILDQSVTPLFFVRGAHHPIRRILVVLRGFASDERALDWLTPLVSGQKAAVTLLPLANGHILDLNHYLHQDSSHRKHLERCLRRLEKEDAAVNLKFRQGDAVAQVVEETAGNDYDLLAIAAEADGSFVNQVITAVDQHHAHNGRPIFVLKPPEIPKNQNYFLLEGERNK
jgi:hypothetical protein